MVLMQKIKKINYVPVQYLSKSQKLNMDQFSEVIFKN